MSYVPKVFSIKQPSKFSLDKYVHLGEYDIIVLWFSGGKDSIACYLALLLAGIKPEQIELHHHLVDGDPAENALFMDWAITEDYCRKFAEAFGSKIYFSWKEGGFLGEANRQDSFTAPIMYENEHKEIITTVGSTNPRWKNTRMKFPQQSASLSERYCSSYLKVDVGDRVLRKEVRFANGKKHLVLSGERAEESSARAKYKKFEPARSDNRDGKRVKRYLDQYRPVHQWPEEMVWEILRMFGVRPHPAYEIGFSRTSCMFCIFLAKNYLATLREYAPERFEAIAQMEIKFGVTINRPKNKKERGLWYHEMADAGTPFDINPALFTLANSTTYDQKIILSSDEWELPIGAYNKYGSSCGAL